MRQRSTIVRADGMQRRSTARSRRWTRLAAMLIALQTVCACTSPPKVAMPDGKSRVPVNTADAIEKFRLQLEEQRNQDAERTRWATEVQTLRDQVAELRSATVILAAHAEGRAVAPARPDHAARTNSVIGPVAAEGRSRSSMLPAPSLEPVATLRNEADSQPVRVMQVSSGSRQGSTEQPVRVRAVPPAEPPDRPATPDTSATRPTGVSDPAPGSSPPYDPNLPAPSYQQTSFSSAVVEPKTRPTHHSGPWRRDGGPTAARPANSGDAMQPGRTIRIPAQMTALGTAQSSLSRELVQAAHAHERIEIGPSESEASMSPQTNRQVDAQAAWIRRMLISEGIDASRIVAAPAGLSPDTGRGLLRIRIDLPVEDGPTLTARSGR